MKKTALFLLAPLAVASVRASTIAIYTFETSPPGNSAGPYAADVGAGSALGFHSGVIGATTYSSPAGNGSAKSFSANGWNVGDYYQFQVSSLGLSGLAISFDEISSSTGPKDFNLQYSTDGSSFTTFASYSVLLNGAPNAPWSASSYNSLYTYSYDLSSVSALDNQSAVYFRLTDADTTSTGGTGTVAAGGTDRIDNVTISTVPEPTTLGLSLLAGLALFGVKARRA